MRVLLAYDGSESADEARDLVAAIQLPPGSEMRVVTAYAPYLPGSFWPDELFDLATPEALFEADRVAAQGLAMTAAERIGRPDTPVTWVAAIGRPASVVLDEAAAWLTDLLVVGTRGLGPFTAALLGSVSAEIVDHAACPVLVVRRPSIERVILAEDGSAGARAAAALLAWPIFARSRVRIVAVSGGEAHDIAVPGPAEAALDDRLQMSEARRAAVGALAGSTADRLDAAGLTTEIDIRQGDPAHEIVRGATDWKADVIVMGTRGRNGLDPSSSGASPAMSSSMRRVRSSSNSRRQRRTGIVADGVRRHQPILADNTSHGCVDSLVPGCLHGTPKSVDVSGGTRQAA